MIQPTVISGHKRSRFLFFSINIRLHPEIVIMGLPQETSMALLHDLVNEIQKGKKFKDGTIDKNLASMSIGFKTVDKSHYDEYLGYGKWFYKSLKTEFPTVQYIWPDKEKKFPWKNGYNESYFQLQKKLYEKR